MRYASLKANGYGSGVVEAANEVLVSQRMKRACMRCGPPTPSPRSSHATTYRRPRRARRLNRSSDRARRTSISSSEISSRCGTGGSFEAMTCEQSNRRGKAGENSAQRRKVEVRFETTARPICAGGVCDSLFLRPPSSAPSSRRGSIRRRRRSETSRSAGDRMGSGRAATTPQPKRRRLAGGRPRWRNRVPGVSGCRDFGAPGVVAASRMPPRGQHMGAVRRRPMTAT